MQRALAEFIARPTEHLCLLIVHPDVRALAQAIGEIAQEHGWPSISLGAELSAALLDEPRAGRSRAARRWLPGRVGPLAPGPVMLTDIDLLFEPVLQLDPLSLLLSASRTTRLVVAWPGTAGEGVLTYAVPEHSAYRTWTHPQALIGDLT